MALDQFSGLMSEEIDRLATHLPRRVVERSVDRLLDTRFVTGDAQTINRLASNLGARVIPKQLYQEAYNIELEWAIFRLASFACQDVNGGPANFRNSLDPNQVYECCDCRIVEREMIQGSCSSSAHVGIRIVQGCPQGRRVSIAYLSNH